MTSGLVAGPGTSRLGVDFGTSSTVAMVVWPDGRTRPLLFDGTPVLPSAVCGQPTGELLVGRDAVDAAPAYPDRFEPHPKRRMDDGVLLLGDREVPVVAAIGAVLRRVVDEARRVVGAAPGQVVLTHPASWAARRREVLDAAAVRAGIAGARLATEPVAAGHYFVEVLGRSVSLGGHLLVYDLGAGTFDASVLRRVVDGFSGRDAELAALDALVAGTPATERQAPIIVAIDGAPGIGKTALAVHWAHHVAERYPDAQLHLNLRGYGPGDPVAPATAIEAMLRGLGVAGEEIPPSLDERSALLRTTLAGRSAMILLDNARDAGQVRPLLPGTAGLVIVTSRNQLRGLSVRDGAHRLTMDRLPEPQAVALLAAAIGAERVDAEPAAASRLVALCDHLPLALSIVAERVNRTSALADVVCVLEDEKARLDNRDTGESDTDTGLRAALSWSYGALTPEAAAMFRKLGLHPANEIGMQAAAALADLPIAQAKASLDQLVAVHMVEQRRTHRYELCEQLDYPRGTALNLDNLGVALAVAGDYARAIASHEHANAINRLTGDTSAEAMNQHHLGCAYAGLGDVRRSTRAFRAAISLYRRLGSRRWEAAVLADLGKMLNGAGHPDMARSAWEAAMRTMNDLGDPRAEEIRDVLTAGRLPDTRSAQLGRVA